MNALRCAILFSFLWPAATAAQAPDPCAGDGCEARHAQLSSAASHLEQTRNQFVSAVRQLIQIIARVDGDDTTSMVTGTEELARALARWDQSLRTYRTVLLDSAAPSADVHVALAAAYLERGKGAEALKHATSASRLDPARSDSYILQGLAYDLEKRPIDAAKSLAIAAKLSPRHPAATYGLAQRLIVIGDEAGATDALRRFDAAQSATRNDGPASPPRAAPFVRVGLLRQSADNPVLFAPSGHVHAFSLLADGALDQAIVEFRAVAPRLSAAVTHSDDFTRQTLADVLVPAERPADAERVLLAAIDASPKAGGAHYQLARLYQSLGRNADAIRELERAAAFPPVVGQDHFYDMLGVLYTSDGDLDGALTAYRRRVLANPNNGDAHRKLGQIYLELGRHNEASAEFTAALMLDPMNAEACAGRAQIRLRLGDYADAAKWARATLMLNRTHAAAQYTLGASLIRLGQLDEGNAALEEFRRLQAAAQAAADEEWELKLTRQSAQARIDAGDFGEAAALLEQVVSRRPDAAINHVNLGIALERAGRYEAAIDAYRKAVALNADANVHARLAAAYAALGRAQESQAEQALDDRAKENRIRAGGQGR
jgi:tetratricopeptide (TPR) repeat protein